jgi:hypothetical protein
MSKYEKIITIHNWWDGPLQGVANYKGTPHIYNRTLNEKYEEIFLITPLVNESYELIIEGYEIWKRWVVAFEEGLAPLNSHPCLPNERERYYEIKEITKPLFDSKNATIKVKGKMRKTPNTPKPKYNNHSFDLLEIKWTV